MIVGAFKRQTAHGSLQALMGVTGSRPELAVASAAPSALAGESVSPLSLLAGAAASRAVVTPSLWALRLTQFLILLWTTGSLLFWALVGWE